MDGTMNVDIHGQNLLLMPQRAVFWPKQTMLIIADVHFGKAAVFRRNGIAIPHGTTADTLARLDQALVWTGARTLLILGDLMHAAVKPGEGIIRQIGQWRQARPTLRILLVNGNHDQRAGPPPEAFAIHHTYDHHMRHPFCFVHRPKHVSKAYAIGGHLHPAVRLSGAGRQRAWLPCFYFGRSYAVLPAFGGFTGHSPVWPQTREKVFVIAGKRVIAPAQR